MNNNFIINIISFNTPFTFFWYFIKLINYAFLKKEFSVFQNGLSYIKNLDTYLSVIGGNKKISMRDILTNSKFSFVGYLKLEIYK